MAKEIHKFMQAHFESEFSWIKIEVNAPAPVIAKIEKAVDEIIKEAEEDVAMRARSG